MRTFYIALLFLGLILPAAAENGRTAAVIIFLDGEDFEVRDSSGAVEVQPPVWEIERKQKAYTIAGSAFLSVGLIMETIGIMTHANGYRIRNSSQDAASLKNLGSMLAASGTFFLAGSIFNFLRAAALGREIEELSK